MTEAPMAYNGNSDTGLGDPLSWEEIARQLFNILDDIDTADDLAKGNESLYRNLVRRYHKQRFEYATTDGYTVNFNTRTDIAARLLEELEASADMLEDIMDNRPWGSIQEQVQDARAAIAEAKET